MSDTYDLVVIGGGPGGLAAAEMAGRAKKRVLLIEKDGWGGTCTHRGCIPTKALLSSSKVYTDLKKLKRLGISVASATADFIAMKKHRDQIVRLAAAGAQKNLADAQVQAVSGEAYILSPRDVRYTDSEGMSRTVSADKLLIAWGSEPQLLKGITLSERILTSDGILQMSALPTSMIIVGGSFIGIEYATVFAELGVKVILVELLDRILPLEDDEAASFLQTELGRLGVAIHTSARLESLREYAGGVAMQVKKDGALMEMRAECALLCTGRKPVLHRTQLDALGVAYDETGIRVDEHMQTSVPGIYAAGDVTGGMMLAHRASAQARVAVADMFGGASVVYDENVIPSVVYSHPPIARVGYTERRAREEGLAIDIVKSDYGANILARTELSGPGFVKAVFAGEHLLGATIVGDSAADLIAPLTLAVSAGLTRQQLRNWILPHPALSEIFLPLTA